MKLTLRPCCEPVNQRVERPVQPGAGPDGYWPDQGDPANPIATAINSLPKYVVSRSLTEAGATWRGEHPDTARLVTGDVVAAVRALKAEPGDELQVWGSGDLLQTLLQHEHVPGMGGGPCAR